MIYRYTIPVDPRTKKNSLSIAYNRRTGAPFIRQSEQYSEFEEAAAYYLLPRPSPPISYPVNVKCVFYMKTRRRVDKSNLEAAVHDILVENLILADDNRDIIAATDGSRVYYDKEHPRVEITISPLGEEYEQWKRRDEA